MDDATEAVFTAFLYDHPGNPEVFIDTTFGTWGGDSVDDHETFGSRTGRVEPDGQIGCSLVAGAELAPDSPIYGVKLTREQALTHPRLAQFGRSTTRSCRSRRSSGSSTPQRTLRANRWRDRPVVARALAG